jgi:hypothetical protein
MNEELLTKLQQRAERATKVAAQIRALDKSGEWKDLPWDLAADVFHNGKSALQKLLENELKELVGEPHGPVWGDSGSTLITTPQDMAQVTCDGGPA